MKFRSTLLLLFVAAGIFVYVWFVENKRPSAKEVQERGERVTQIDRDKITAISIRNSESKIELRKKDNGTWQMEAPIKDRADISVLNQLFTTTESLKHDAMIGADKGASKEQLKEFGLSNSDTRIKLTGAEKPVELIVGKDAAVEGKTYAKLEGSGTVYVVSNDLKNQLTKKPDDFRDRKLTELNTAQVNKAVIRSSAGELELVKKDGHWSLLKPLNARGDDSKIGDVISQATTARIDTFVADSANLAAYGLQDPRGTVSLYVEDAKEPVVLQIGANPNDEKDKEKTYAKLSTRDSVVLLPKAIEQLLSIQPNDLRDRNLVRVEPDIVDRITIESTGAEKIVLARKGEDWVRKGDKDVSVNGAMASALLSAIRAEQVTKFVSDVATELPKHGLDQPQVKLTLSSFASENTAEEKAGEKPIVTLLFGNIEGDTVFVKLDDEPFILAVSRKILDSIPTDPIRWQDLTIYNFKPEDITSFEVAHNGQAPVALQREKDQWKLAKGDGAVNQANAQSLVNTLASLRSVKWSGPAKPEDGFEKPKTVVTFKTLSASGKLTFGAATPDAMSLAKAEGLTGVFVVSQPDRSAFDLLLVDKPPVNTPPTVMPTGAGASPAAILPPAPVQPAPVPMPSTPPVPAPMPDATPSAAPPAAPAAKPAAPATP